jgi:hypothetical protein
LPPPEAIPIAAPETYSKPPAVDAKKEGGKKEGGLEDVCKVDPAACPNLDMDKEAARKFNEPLYAVQQVYAGGGGPDLSDLFGSPAPTAPSTPTAPAAIPMKPSANARPEAFDMEAKVEVEVSDIERARRKLAELTHAAGGQLMNEVFEKGADRLGAALSLRIPSAGIHAFIARLGEIGKIRTSTLETHEVSRKIADAEVIVRNLEQVLRRYEELLAKATNVAETIQVEAQLARVRTELDRVRSDLEWSKDRAARSTAYVTLSLEPTHPPLEPTAKLHPGVRSALFYDVVPNGATTPSTAYAGGGISVAWPRRISMDLDLLTSLRDDPGGVIDFYVFTIGTDIYSDFLGGGTRTFLNPYVGFRTGFAHAPNQALFPLGLTVGVDFYKTRGLLIAAESRTFALLGRKQGADFGIEPSLGLNVAY